MLLLYDHREENKQVRVEILALLFKHTEKRFIFTTGFSKEGAKSLKLWFGEARCHVRSPVSVLLLKTLSRGWR
jgi:hypothetical protein